MDEIRIGYFLEDIGQERFLKALVNRVAREMRLSFPRLRHEVRNATGGRGVVLEELRRFLRDVNHEREHLFALLVVAIDGNCHSYRKRRAEIRVPAASSDERIQEIAMQEKSVQKHLEGREPKKVIVVPGRLINIVG